jgi:hypothetical protein
MRSKRKERTPTLRRENAAERWHGIGMGFCIPATAKSQLCQRFMSEVCQRYEPVTNLNGLVTLPPSSSGSGISMSGIFAVW